MIPFEAYTIAIITLLGVILVIILPYIQVYR